MKKSIVIAVLLMITLIAKSQHLVQENKTWNVIESMNFGGSFTQSFRISGDTTLGQSVYKILLATYDTTLINWEFFGGIREFDNQVFLYHASSETEAMLYDFNLEVGSTFNSINLVWDCPIELSVSSIETITLANGEEAQQINFGFNGFHEEQWIAGIGSLNGLVNIGTNQCITDVWSDLSCCYLGDELIFQNPGINSCFVYTLGTPQNVIHTNPIIYPNPFSDGFILEFNFLPLQNYHLQIINSMGQIVLNIENISSGKIVVPGNRLSSGVHFYRLFNDKDMVASGTVFKENDLIR
ncbi:MAG: T9SS type A sorting domain-containing protein [Lentimicrobium sp.]|nr:T9SS type A sorting domain-containing protein [Lentimicrobium sp.]